MRTKILHELVPGEVGKKKTPFMPLILLAIIYFNEVSLTSSEKFFFPKFNHQNNTEKNRMGTALFHS